MNEHYHELGENHPVRRRFARMAYAYYLANPDQYMIDEDSMVDDRQPSYPASVLAADWYANNVMEEVWVPGTKSGIGGYGGLTNPIYTGVNLRNAIGANWQTKSWIEIQQVNAAENVMSIYYVSGARARYTQSRQTPTTRIYHERVLNPKDPGPYHRFPGSFDEVIISRGTRTVISDSYVQYTLGGSVNGVSGTYEIGIQTLSTGTELITHRFFQP
jgi:hypothetical protein